MNTPARASATAGQVWDPRAYARHGGFVSELGAPVLDWLAPRIGERIFDLGCGDGTLTGQIAAAGCSVVGGDASAEFVAVARERGLDAHLVDGQALLFREEFDAVFSNAALHWMKRDPDAVLTGVARALKPGGRFVAEMGAAGNVATIRAAVYDALTRRGIDAVGVDPWYFPTAGEYGVRLENAGFTLARIECFPRPTPLPGDVAGWLRTFAQAFLEPVPQSERAAVVAEVQEILRPQLGAAGVWVADYVRLRFIALKRVSA
jgi:SAM-dependent methyltransferase